MGVTNQSRVQAGVPSGGQFAATPHAEAPITLSNDTAAAAEAGDPFCFDDDLDWDDLGFSGAEMARWIEVGVSDPQVALRCADAGLVPRFASHPWKKLESPGEPVETITIGRAIQTGIIDDLDIDMVAAWAISRTRASDTAATYGDPFRYREHMDRAAKAEAELARRGVQVPKFEERPLDPHSHGYGWTA